jgi:hypothetical protein
VVTGGLAPARGSGLSGGCWASTSAAQVRMWLGSRGSASSKTWATMVAASWATLRLATWCVRSLPWRRRGVVCRCQAGCRVGARNWCPVVDRPRPFVRGCGRSRLDFDGSPSAPANRDPHPSRAEGPGGCAAAGVLRCRVEAPARLGRAGCSVTVQPAHDGLDTLTGPAKPSACAAAGWLLIGRGRRATLPCRRRLPAPAGQWQLRSGPTRRSRGLRRRQSGEHLGPSSLG